ncbi:olfactory receptor 6C68-like [Echinops telfairi]|uniref:Olfactory receptor n=1 Tax=Echinops telfairi TaxID=9371 RepID=A0ABM0IIP1_ECHTE|nr:olfactory receptor 6C68-like [Echinops telfairi]
MRNHTTITTFILLGLTEDPYLQVLILIFLLITYMLCISGNLTIIILTWADAHLKTPMYFFLQNFSFLEILLTTASIPRFMYSISTGDRTITYTACFVQLFFIDFFTASEFFLLAIMSYDRYVAICKPLHYMTIMSIRVCRTMVICCWVIAVFIILPLFCLIVSLEFCDSNAINHFACDELPLLEISCSDTWLAARMVTACAGLIFITTLVCVVLSYISIMKTILKFPSAKQRKKAFSTCSSHMIVVSISYGSCIFIYIKTSGKEDVEINKSVSLLIASISPMLSPFIYTLRNKQVKQAFIDLIKKIPFPPRNKVCLNS